MSDVLDEVFEIPPHGKHKTLLPEHRLAAVRRDFGVMFHQTRKEAGFNRQIDLAKKSGVSPHIVTHIELGHMIRTATVAVLKIFAEAFCCELYFENAEPEEQFGDDYTLNEILRKGITPRFLKLSKKIGG